MFSARRQPTVLEDLFLPAIEDPSKVMRERMKKHGKHYTPEEKVATLNLLDKEPHLEAPR